MLVEYREESHGAVTLMDREAIATLTKRSPHTVRARCRVVERTPDGRPLYDAYECEATLSTIPTRNRAAGLTTE